MRAARVWQAYSSRFQGGRRNAADQLIQRVRRVTRPALLGTLRRTNPVSDVWGFDRGTPIDRYYIEQFLGSHMNDIQGRVLEILDSQYSNQFGNEITHKDVLDIHRNNPLATFVADLAAADAVPSDLFDCFILTQTLHLTYDVRSAIAHARRMLRPGGVLLATLPAISRISRSAGVEGDFWRLTPATAHRLFSDEFGAEQVSVTSYGNVLAGIAFFAGLAMEELSKDELDVADPYFPVIVTVRAVK